MSENLARVIDYRQLEAVIGGSRSANYAKTDPTSPSYDPDFPASVNPAGKKRRYLSDDVERYLAVLAGRAQQRAGRVQP